MQTKNISKILKILSKNARIPLIDIAEKLKTPERTIAFRKKQNNPRL